jgi:Heterokaryon incompatibility protein (HET)
MEGSTNTFQYRPLSQDEPEIRLVSLLPASDPSAEIHCELLYTSLDEPDLYEPLSYAWGDPTITELIFLDDHKFAITTNFCSALKHLRLADQPRTLWIDSICIDQLNITERNYQVQHMRPIYEDAPRTLVWLGEEGDAGEAINFLVEMDNLMWGSGVVDNLAPDQPSAIGVRRVQNQRGKEAVTKLCDSLTMPEELRRTARALDRCQDLFDRRWFKRSWVMQEVFHTKFVIFYIGKISLSFRRLEDLWQTFTICIQILLRILKQVKDDAGIPASYLGSECMFLYGDLDAGIPLITAGRDHQYSYWVGNWKL